jgi:hypothetical protein
MATTTTQGIPTAAETIEVKERCILRIIRLYREGKVCSAECDTVTRRCRDEIRELRRELTAR